MPKLKLGVIPNEKPVKLMVEIPADVYRHLAAYAELLSRETGKTVEPAKLAAPMLARFMATDRGFARALREKPKTNEPPRTTMPSEKPSS